MKAGRGALKGNNAMKYQLAAAACLAVGVAMSAAARAGDGNETSEDGVDQRLGAEVSRICFPRNINNWKEVDGEDNVILLEQGVNDWHRVELAGACRYSDIRFTQKIALETRPAGGCVTKGDVITLIDNTGFNNRCTIIRINEWDDDAPAPGEEEGGT